MKNFALKLYVTSAAALYATSSQAQQSGGPKAADEIITGDGGWLDQLAAFGMLALALAFLAGVCCVCYGFYYYIKKSDNPQEQDAGSKTMKFLLGGGALTIVPLLIGIITLTIGGDGDATNAVSDQLSTFQQ